MSVHFSPELAPTVGFDQHSVHHAYDIFTHTAHVVEAVSATPALRWAALLHDVGKPDTFTLDSRGCGHFYGHAQCSAQMADRILLRLKAPTALRQDVVFLVDKHMTFLPSDKNLLRRRLSQYGQARLSMLLQLQKADFGAKGVTGDMSELSVADTLLQQLLAENACLHIRDLAVNGHDLIALGYSGPAIGTALQYLLDQVLDERLPNEKTALLAALRAPTEHATPH